MFGLTLAMLLHWPRGTGSVGRDELAKRASDFAHGRFQQFLSEASHHAEQARSFGKHKIKDTMERRGGAAQTRVEGSLVSRARQGLTGGIGTQDESNIRRVAEEEATGASEADSSAVLAFVPERQLELDFGLLTRCLQSAPSGKSPGPGGCSKRDVASVRR